VGLLQEARLARTYADINIGMTMGKSSEDTIQKVKAPAFGVLLSLCCSVACACYLGSYMRIPVVPLYARSLGANTFQVGMINSSFLLMAALLSLPLGILSDRLGRKLLILAGLVLSACSSFLLVLSTSAIQMMGIYLLFGISLAMFAPTMMSYVADVTPPTHLGRAYGWYTMAIYGGMSMGPAAGGMMAEWLGFGPVFVLSGILVLLVFGIVFFFLPRARHVVIHQPQKRDTAAALKDLSRNPRLLGCWLVTLGGCFALGMFVTFVPLHASEQGMNAGEIGFIFAAQAVSNALSRIPFGRLSDRVAKRSTLVVTGLFGLSAAVAGFGIASGMLGFVLCAIGLGISMGIAFTSVGALISEVVAADSRGLAMGGYNSSIYLGMMLSSLLMGALAGHMGFAICFYLVGLANAATTCAFQFIMRKFDRGGIV
jgi:MFS transporter, DHA1 family, multidrug resistance protein